MFHDDKLDETLRRGFVRKVYGIVFFQTLLTALVATLFSVSEPWRFWCLTSPSLTLFSGLAFVLLMILTCVPSLRYSHPTNMILLFAFTLCMAVGVGQACALVTATHNSPIVLQALFTSVAATLGLVVFAMQTRYDLSFLNGFLSIALFAVLGLSALMLLFPYVFSFLDMITSFVTAVIFGGYIMVDTQMINRGSNTSYDPDDYISAALNLYIDIINLFMAIMQMLDKRKDDEDADK